MPNCPKCGRKVREEMNFCPNCGVPLMAMQLPQPPPEAPPSAPLTPTAPSEPSAPYKGEKSEKREKQEKEEREEKHEKMEREERYEKREYGYMGPLFGGLFLIFIGLVLYLTVTASIRLEAVGAILFVIIGIIIIAGAVYAAVMAARRHPPT